MAPTSITGQAARVAAPLGLGNSSKPQRLSPVCPLDSLRGKREDLSRGQTEKKKRKIFNEHLNNGHLTNEVTNCPDRFLLEQMRHNQIV